MLWAMLPEIKAMMMMIMMGLRLLSEICGQLDTKGHTIPVNVAYAHVASHHSHVINIDCDIREHSSEICLSIPGP